MSTIFPVSRTRRDNYYNNMSVVDSTRIPQRKLSLEPNRAKGFFLYNTENNLLYYSNGISWQEILSSGNGSLADVLLIGNTTGGTNIEISATDSIVGDSAAAGSGLSGGALPIVGGAGDGAGNGGAVTVTGGAAGATGQGGSVSLEAANGGTTSGQGGDIGVTAGDSGDGDTNGGDVSIVAGSVSSAAVGSPGGTGGNVTIASGTGNGDGTSGGDISIAAGSGSSTGGSITIDSGDGGTMAGSFTLSTGSGSGPGIDGGDLSMTSGNSTSGTAGILSLTAGNGLSDPGGIGGSVLITAGNTEDATSRGGDVVLTGGLGPGGGLAFSTGNVVVNNNAFTSGFANTSAGAAILELIPVATDNSAYMSVKVIGVRTGGGGAGESIVRIDRIRAQNDGGVLTISTIDTFTDADAAVAAWTITVDVSGTNVRVFVNSIADDGTWRSQVEIMSVP